MPPEETIQEKNEQATQQDKTEGQQLASAVQNAASAINQRDQGAPVIEPEQVRSTQQVNIPQVPDGGLADETIAQADQQMTPTEIAAQAEQEQRQRTQSVRDEVQSLINRAAGRGERQTEIEENLGIDEQQDKLSTVNEEIAALQEAHRKRMRELGAGPGATAEQVNDLQRQEKTRHAARLADKQIIKSAIQGNIDRIQSNAQRKVDLEFEPIEQQLEFQKQFLEQNQELLSDAQQTRLKTAINTSQKRMTRQREKAEELQNTKTQLITNASQQNAPKYVLDQIQDATSREDAIQAAGDFGVSVDTQLERQQARADLRATEADIAATQALERQRLSEIESTGAGSIENVPEEFESVVDQAATLAGAADQREQTARIMRNALANENYTQAYAQIANNVEEALTGTTKTDFANSRTDIGVMQGMKEAIEEYVQAGGDTGFLKGKAEDIAQNFGQLANSDDPQFAALGAQLQREFQSYRNNMTGAAFGPAESRQYAKVNPTTDKSLDLNLAIMEGALNQLENRITSTVEERVPGSEKIYQRAVTGGNEVQDVSWDEVPNLNTGDQFTVGGTVYEKVGDDNYIEVK